MAEDWAATDLSEDRLVYACSSRRPMDNERYMELGRYLAERQPNNLARLLGEAV